MIDDCFNKKETLTYNELDNVVKYNEYFADFIHLILYYRKIMNHVYQKNISILPLNASLFHDHIILKNDVVYNKIVIFMEWVRDGLGQGEDEKKGNRRLSQTINT